MRTATFNITEDGNIDCPNIGYIDNVTIEDREVFMDRLMEALMSHFDSEDMSVDEFDYNCLFDYEPLTIGVLVREGDGYHYDITIAETWKY